VLEQFALADLLERGDVDRHLRRTRRLYRGRRDALVAAVARELPDAELVGAPAGLHALVLLDPDIDEERLLSELRTEGVACHGLGLMRVTPQPGDRAGLVLGYAHLSESAIARASAAVGKAVASVRGPRTSVGGHIRGADGRSAR
jgi:GntR family transcriptional regulator/MocR family aminotransferase